MKNPLTILQVVHGFPPREVAGTELYTARLTAALRARGHRVVVLAGTRDPGQPHGSLHPPNQPGAPWRLVNNLPWRPLARGERDAGLAARMVEVRDRVQPDLVHLQHLIFLSVGVDWRAPTIATLHDGWGWCARGGTLLRDGVRPCPGPEPQACADCYADWARGGAMEHALGHLAGQVGRWLPAEHLQSAWSRLPPSVRSVTRRGPPPRTSAPDATLRQQAVGDAFRACSLRLAPSRFLAEEAEVQGLGPSVHLPHGVAPGIARVGGGPCVFLGSLVPHKGAHLVAQAWSQLAATRDVPPLVIHGPATDPQYAASLPAEHLGGPVDPADVPGLLSRASVLILGSTWPENSPLVVLEARSAGCPVVAPDLGGLPELIEPGRDGMLYAPGDPGALAAALAQVLDHPSIPRPPPSFEDHVDALSVHYARVLG